jgi:DNA-directed RNA polymerase specialized sigma24 family protein
MSQRQPKPEFEVAPAEQALSLELVSESDLLRLKTIARLRARGLPWFVSWADLLQEAFRRVLDGSRKKPDELPMVVFLAGVMRSIRSEVWRQAQSTRRRLEKLEALPELFTAPSTDPNLVALDALAQLDRLFADDIVARRIIAALGEGLSAQEIRIACDLSKTEYESARKRIRRVLLREGLTMAVK